MRLNRLLRQCNHGSTMIRDIGLDVEAGIIGSERGARSRGRSGEESTRTRAAGRSPPPVRQSEASGHGSDVVQRSSSSSSSTPIGGGVRERREPWRGGTPAGRYRADPPGPAGGMYRAAPAGRLRSHDRDCPDLGSRRVASLRPLPRVHVPGCRQIGSFCRRSGQQKCRPYLPGGRGGPPTGQGGSYPSAQAGGCPAVLLSLAAGPAVARVAG
jgi:hypothetical protein